MSRGQTAFIVGSMRASLKIALNALNGFLILFYGAITLVARLRPISEKSKKNN
jgi:ascorbate-specific PTS system EIIC-type component UlaA